MSGKEGEGNVNVSGNVIVEVIAINQNVVEVKKDECVFICGHSIWFLRLWYGDGEEVSPNGITSHSNGPV
jgi:hypothetical protein